MKIEIKPVIRPLYLSEYAAEYETEAVQVWVNPPRRLRLELYTMIDEFQAVQKALGEGGLDEEMAQAQLDTVNDLGPRLHAWYAEVWSQHEDAGTHWTVEEVSELVEAATENDPGLWDFLQTRTLDMMTAHREASKKK